MEDFTCKSVRRSMWDYVAGLLDEVDSHGVRYHLQACRLCDLHRVEVRSMRTGLRHLPGAQIPSMLGTKLRVLASREHARQIRRRDFQTRFHDFRRRFKVSFDNLLKPFAVPAAGGVLASFLCFGMILGNFYVATDWENDLPIGVSTDVSIDELSPFDCGRKDVLVKLSVDSDGHVTDYELQPDKHASPEEMQEIGNLVLYSTFNPAIRSGRRVSSKRLFFMSHISVRG